MTEAEFKSRTRQIALRIIRLVQALPRSQIAEILGKQLIRSGTSIGANYRAACRGKSRADVLHKLAIVEEEADEALYWIDLLTEAGLVAKARVAPLQAEVDEVVAMIVASIRTMKVNNSTNPKSKI